MKGKILYQKLLSMFLAFVIACGVFSPMSVSAQGKEDAEIIMLGDTISGVSSESNQFEWFYFEVPAKMNVTLRGYIAGGEALYGINIVKPDGSQPFIRYNDKEWTYSRPRMRYNLNYTITLNKGSHYMWLYHTYKTNGRRYSIKVDGKLTSNVRISKVKKASRTSAKISWNKVRGVKGYEVYRSSSKKGTYKKIATVKGSSYTNKKLKRNRSYYYKVRAYITSKGNKYYTPYSSPKKIRM